MSVYVDTSAVIKLIAQEPESDALEQFVSEVDSRDEMLLASWLTETELMRFAQREDLPFGLTSAVLNRFDIVGMPHDVYLDAGLLPGRDLRSLDSIHVAIALATATDTFVTYDTRQSEAATAAGLTVAAPS